MRNRFVLDSNYDVQMLCNIQEPYDEVEHWRNSILLEVDADSTANQYIIVTGPDGDTETFNVTASQVNVFTILEYLWNYGDTTKIEFYKNGVKQNDETLFIGFPDVVDGSAAVSSETEVSGLVYLGQFYSMAGSYFSDGETIKDLTEKVEKAEDDISTAQDDIQTLTGNVGTLQEDVAVNTQDIQNLQGLITLSTQDITPGVTTLASGHLYLVYE